MSSAASPAATIARTRPGWSTPRLLQTGRIVLLLLIVLLLIVELQSTAMHRKAMDTISHDTAPSIIAAQRIRASISGMNAELANELLSAPESGLAALTNYDAQRDQAAAALVAAAENITFGESERGPIRTLGNGLAIFEELSQKIRDEHETNDPATMETYHQAESLVSRSLLPAANDLDRANSSVLERTYREATTNDTVARGGVIFFGLLVLASLVTMQAFLSQRTRRTLNPMLLGSTLLVLCITVHTVSAMSTATEQRRVAKADAFDSVSALWRARAVAYKAEGEESQFLLEPAFAPEAQRAFTTDVDLLAHAPDGLSPDQLVAASRNGPPVDGFNGYLADELRNVTFPGERDAALQTLVTFESYTELDARVRELARSGQHGRAVDLSVSPNPGGAAWAFRQFDGALGDALAMNQQAFEAAAADSQRALRGLDLETLAALVVAGFLIFLGVDARLREYR